jgi:hypothetical protein
LAQSTSYARGLVDYSLRCARGLLRPPSTFTFPTTLGDLSTTLYAVLEDCADHRARLRSQPRSGTCPPVPTPCSGTVPTTEHYTLGDWSTSSPIYELGDCTDHRALYARGLVDQPTNLRIRGLYRPPSVICSGTGRLVYSIADEHDMLGDW